MRDIKQSLHTASVEWVDPAALELLSHDSGTAAHARTAALGVAGGELALLLSAIAAYEQAVCCLSACVCL